MKKEDLYNYISGISEKYLNEADNYRPHRKIHWKKWVSVAACLCLIAAVAIIPMLTDKQSVSPFVLTAYAAGYDDLVSNEMVENKSVPVSLFETASGIKGFVFSSGEKIEGEPATIAIVSGDKSFSENPGFEEILKLEMESGKHYFYYIPDSADTAPYQITLFISDQDVGMVFKYEMTIEETADGYSATLNKAFSEKIRSVEDYSFNVFAEFEISNDEDGNKDAKINSLISVPSQD